LKKLTRCPVCGSRGEDVIFAFYCINDECQNYRKDITPILDYEKKDDKEFNSIMRLWPWSSSDID
jgi:hypothetical protein